MIISNYGQERNLDCTDEERKIFENIVTIIGDALLDPSVLRLIRKSDNYVSAVMDSTGDYGAMDVARIKFTSRAKWLKIGPSFEKVSIRTPEDVLDYRQDVVDAYRANEPYL